MDNAKVQGYIDESFDQQNRVYKGIARLSQAHAWLYQKRQSDDPNDDNDELAAAEHYMWALEGRRGRDRHHHHAPAGARL